MNNDNKNLIEELEAKFDELFSDLDDELPNPDNENNTVTLTDENGDGVEFEFLDLITYDGEDYVILLPVDDCEDSGEVVILKLEKSDNENEESYVSIDDEHILTTVFTIFKDKFKDYFNFVD